MGPHPTFFVDRTFAVNAHRFARWLSSCRVTRLRGPDGMRLPDVETCSDVSVVFLRDQPQYLFLKDAQGTLIPVLPCSLQHADYRLSCGAWTCHVAEAWEWEQMGREVWEPSSLMPIHATFFSDHTFATNAHHLFTISGDQLVDPEKPVIPDWLADCQITRLRGSEKTPRDGEEPLPHVRLVFHPDYPLFLFVWYGGKDDYVPVVFCETAEHADFKITRGGWTCYAACVWQVMERDGKRFLGRLESYVPQLYGYAWRVHVPCEFGGRRASIDILPNGVPGCFPTLDVRRGAALTRVRAVAAGEQLYAAADEFYPDRSFRREVRIAIWGSRNGLITWEDAGGESRTGLHLFVSPSDISEDVREKLAIDEKGETLYSTHIVWGEVVNGDAAGGAEKFEYATLYKMQGDRDGGLLVVDGWCYPVDSVTCDLVEEESDLILNESLATLPSQPEVVVDATEWDFWEKREGEFGFRSSATRFPEQELEQALRWMCREGSRAFREVWPGPGKTSNVEATSLEDLDNCPW